MSDCRYGIHDRTKKDIGETKYYHFLAGLVKVISAKQVLEIGTHFGGSIMAMSKGAHSDTKMVTIDIELKNNEALFPYTNIKRITGDSTNTVVIKEVNKYLKPPIDLIFIDSLHIKKYVYYNMKRYANLLPKYVVFDDIHINSTMDDLWNKVSTNYPSCDLSEMVDRKKAGFGIIQLR